jgi:PAS domain S-box-containing protein
LPVASLIGLALLPQNPSTDSADELPLSRQLGIRRNQLVGLFDRFPVPTAVCYTDGFILRTINPAFCQTVGMRREQLRGQPLLDVVSPVEPAAVERLSDALQHRRHSRFSLQVRWTANDTAFTGHITVELVDEALLDHLPLLVFLHVEHRGRATDPRFALEPMAARILTLVAGGASTSAVARTVGLTVDGVTYHLSRLCRRLKVPNRTALVARAYVLGLLDATTWPPTSATSAEPPDAGRTR